MASRLDDAARRYLGVPWHRLGRTSHGVDCIGLLLLAAKDCGFPIPEIEPYENEPNDHTLIETLSFYCDEISVSDAQPGDIAVFRLGLYGGHVGIISQHPEYRVPSLIHCYAPRKKVIEEPLDLVGEPVWKAFRVRDDVWPS